MKRLMIATAVAAAGFSALFADVYNVKFSAKTPVTADNGTTSIKTVTVQGLWEIVDGQTKQYAFWSVQNGYYAPLKNATLALVTEGKFTTKGVDNPKQVAQEYELLWGEEGWGEDVTKLQGVFVAAGLTKNTVKNGAALLSSMSGNFAGQMDTKPAYGTWSLSKNSTATKKGFSAGFPKQLGPEPDFGASKESELAAWKENMKGVDSLRASLEQSLKDLDALTVELTGTTNKLSITEAELAVLVGQYGVATNELAELSGAYGAATGKLEVTEADLAAATNSLAALSLELELAKKNLDSIVEALKGLNDPSLNASVADFLETEVDAMEDAKDAAEDYLKAIKKNYLDTAADAEFKDYYAIYSVSNQAWIAATNAVDIATNAVNAQVTVTNIIQAASEYNKDGLCFTNAWFEARVDESTNLVKQIKDIVDAGEAKVKEWEQNVEDAKDDYEDVVDELDDLKEAIENLDETIATLEKQIPCFETGVYDQLKVLFPLAWAIDNGIVDNNATLEDQTAAWDKWLKEIAALDADKRKDRDEYKNLVTNLDGAKNLEENAPILLQAKELEVKNAKKFYDETVATYEAVKAANGLGEDNPPFTGETQERLDELKAELVEVNGIISDIVDGRYNEADRLAALAKYDTLTNDLAKAEANLETAEANLEGAKAYENDDEENLYAKFTTGNYAANAMFGSPLLDKEAYDAKRADEIDSYETSIKAFEKNIEAYESIIDFLKDMEKAAE